MEREEAAGRFAGEIVLAYRDHVRLAVPVVRCIAGRAAARDGGVEAA
jgi:hypothetical protein